MPRASCNDRVGRFARIGFGFVSTLHSFLKEFLFLFYFRTEALLWQVVILQKFVLEGKVCLLALAPACFEIKVYVRTLLVLVCDNLQCAAMERTA